MGCYINPPDMSKEDWLHEHAEMTEGQLFPPVWDEIPEGHLPVCLVLNAEFTAAAVGYDEQENEAFSYTESDLRPRIWFTAPIEALLEVSDLEKWQR